MDSTDFEMPSPKRQRTNSPSNNQPVTAASTTATTTSSTMLGQQPAADTANLSATQIPGLENISKPDNSAIQHTAPAQLKQPEHDMLDVLMQHVESESASTDMADNVNAAVGHNIHIDALSGAQGVVVSEPRASEPQTVQDAKAGSHADTKPSQPLQPAKDTAMQDLDRDTDPKAADPSAESVLQAHAAAAASSTNIATPQDNAPAGTVAEGEQREWETDSSFNSDSSSDTSSDSDDSDGDDEYTLLDPYEQARILMAEDGGAGGGGGADSDDEGARNRAAAAGATIRTQNEAAEDILPKPDIKVTPDMAIEELGAVEATVENIVLIKAKTSGAYQVLESGSVLCLADRFVVGAVSETLGRVEEPLYTVRYPSAADIIENRVNEKGTKIFYVKAHSTFVFTQPLKAVKGSDASNLHDEEVGDDEMEFSDDEAEAEYKRIQKLKRKGIDPATRGRGRGPGVGNAAGPAARGRGGHMSSIRESYSDNVEMNYDDVEEGETDYTPLRRPDAAQIASMSSTRGQGRGRGRDSRGRGRGRDQSRHQTYQSGHSAYAGYQAPPPALPQMMPHGSFPGQFMPPPQPMASMPATGTYNFDFAAAAAAQWQQYHQNQNTQYQQQFTGQVNADAIAQVARQLEELRRQSQNGAQ